MQTNAVPAAAIFLAPEFERRIAELRAAIGNDRSELETAQKKLAAMSTNRDAITAVGKDTKTEIKNAQAGIQALERRIAVTRSEITQLFRDEYTSFGQLRAETWKTLHTKFVDSTIREIAAAARLLNTQLRAVIALVKSRPSDFSGLLDALKSQADRWNELVRDFAGLVIGGSLAVPESELLRSNVADAFKKVVRDSFGSSSEIAETLAMFAVEPWKQAPPTMAERVEARRKELQRVGEPFNP
jgi:hypothetical protein